MVKIKERYVIDEEGNRVGVFLEITDYRELLRNSRSWNPFVPMMPPRRRAMKPSLSTRRLRRLSAIANELHGQHSAPYSEGTSPITHSTLFVLLPTIPDQPGASN